MSRLLWLEELLAPSFVLIIAFVSFIFVVTKVSELQELSEKPRKLLSSLIDDCEGVLPFIHGGQSSSSSNSSYRDIFPPLSRDGLVRTSQKASRSGLKNPSPQLSEKKLQKNLLPFEQDYRTGMPSQYTTMGVSIAEVQALGAFPDYAELTDVPLPNPYIGFKIESALPRPYRPFRWAYHQTMCMLHADSPAHG